MSGYFSEKRFSRVVRVGDARRFNIDLKNNRAAVFATVLNEANSGTPMFVAPFRTIIKNRHCLSLKSYSNNLILRVIAKHLGHRFRAHPRTRDSLVKEIIETLGDATPIYIIRRDIQSFYETLSIDGVKNRLTYSTDLPARARMYLNAFFKTLCPDDRGLPRGIGVSAIIAEMAMQRTDRKIKEIPGVYKYFRYSDDILIFSYKHPNEVVPELNKIIAEIGLKFNRSKSDETVLDNFSKQESLRKNFEYLGYKFSVSSHCGSTKPRAVDVSISDRKINKVKSRLICSLKHFVKHGDPVLLEDRIRFLASNYYARRSGTTSVKTSIYVRSGIYYNYRYCGVYEGHRQNAAHCSELKELDAFYHFLLRGRSSAFRGHLAKPHLAVALLNLRNISFLKGFEHRMTVRFKPDRVQKIKEAWRNG